jgi:hypothetical protein
MNDFLARNSNIQRSRTAEMASRAVAEAQASGHTPSRHGGKTPVSRDPAGDPDIDQQLSSAAEVAEAQAKIAALLSELDAAPIDSGTLEARIEALLPRPTIIVPMPPASRDVVERAIEIAESIRAAAALSLAAQANVETGMAEGSLA